MATSSKDTDPTVAEFKTYIKDECAGRLREIHEVCEHKCHYGVEIDMVAVGEISERTVQKLLNNPKMMLPLLQTALNDVYKEMFPHIKGSPEPFLHARVCHFPTHAKWCKPNISVLRSTDVGKMISMMATVTRTGSVILREHKREFVCRRCKYSFEVEGDVSLRGEFEVPGRCPRSGGANQQPCYSTSFAPVEDATSLPECREYQEIKLQEKVQHLHVGSIPRSMMCILVDDLADSVKPGDDVLVHGVVHLRWNGSPNVGKRADLELMIIAEHIQTNNERKSFLQVTDEALNAFKSHWANSANNPREQLLARDVILRSVCPQIFGMYIVKLIVAMTLIGGIAQVDQSGSHIRGESHLLMVGDPGTAKSQFLRYSAKVSPRSVLTTGIGTTSAGLTVTAVREPGTGEWMLDAGALVLADGGVCCIDEFDGIKSHDRGSIHEAMQQQTVSVAKAGLVCTLNTRASVIAAVNPKAGRVATEIGKTSESGADEHYENDGLNENNLPITVGIAAPLLSRFDVILTLKDQHDEDWDYQLSSFILDGYRDDGELSLWNANNNVGSTESQRRRRRRNSYQTWSFDRLRQYFYYVKNSLKPELSTSAMKLLTTYYTKERAQTSRNTARTTVRLLEALIRLTQAHARLMFRNTATAMDAAFAIAAVEASAVAQTVVGGVGALHAPFPDDPAEVFDEFARTMLVKLGLEDDGINFYDTPPFGVSGDRDFEYGSDDDAHIDVDLDYNIDNTNTQTTVVTTANNEREIDNRNRSSVVVDGDDDDDEDGDDEDGDDIIRDDEDDEDDEDEDLISLLPRSLTPLRSQSRSRSNGREDQNEIVNRPGGPNSASHGFAPGLPLRSTSQSQSQSTPHSQPRPPSQRQSQLRLPPQTQLQSQSQPRSQPPTQSKARSQSQSQSQSHSQLQPRPQSSTPVQSQGQSQQKNSTQSEASSGNIRDHDLDISDALMEGIDED